jgi:hypothetical protein
MTGAVLVISGVFALVYGSWRGCVAARQAVLPLVRQGDETRTLIEAARPIHERSRVRLAARHAGLSMTWLGVAMYGLCLATVGMAVGA